MEVSTSSSPLSIHSPFARHPRRLASSSATYMAPAVLRRRRQQPTPPAACSWKASVSGSVSLPMSLPECLPRRRKSRRMEVSAVFERFTERAVKVIIFSQREARDFGKDTVFNQHLLLGLVSEEEADTIPIERGGSGYAGFLGSSINLMEARAAVAAIWPSPHPPLSPSDFRSSTDLALSMGTKRVLEGAVEYSRSMGHHFIAPEHIAISLFTVDDGTAAKVLKRLGANMNHLAAEAFSRLQGELEQDGRFPPESIPPEAAQGKASLGKQASIRSSEKSREKSVLAQFCVDLTARAAEGHIDPVVGRDTEVKRIVQILCRRTKNNPILLGEAGVGKTAIAEGLATKIADLDVPPFLLSKKIMSLDVGLLIAGAKERGELEARVTAILKDIKKSGNIILFIDEVHTIIGSGTAGQGNKGSGLDVANLLKPSLGRGDLQCIASTTLDEYRSHLESDKALARRFQPVLINEPTEEDAVRILLGLQEKYESHHKCTYTLESINAAVHLSSRYIPDRYLPDKAIDLIDEAGSRAHIETYKKKKEQQTCILSKSPDDYWQEIRAVKAMHDAVIANRPRLMYDSDALSAKDSDFSLPSESNDDEVAVVEPDDIAAVVSLWSGIPVQKLTADERLLLVGLEENLRKRVVGQEEAVSAISRAVKRSRVGLNDPKRPIAAMLFCGPTGVGKTELTKALAACYFGSESAILRLDMSEYMERHTVSKLIGAPPGYIGYGEGGTLTEAIRRRPFTVVLLDEIEKAHPDIFNILLQMFEDGHLTDSEARRVSFKNALVVMTSNVGSSTIAKGGRASFGFLTADDESASYAGLKALVTEELKSYFRPELLNRIDEVVVFRALEKTQMMEILKLMLGDVRKRLIGMGIRLEVTDPVMDLVCQQGYDRVYGARPLRRAVSQIIEDLLSEALLSGDYKPGDTAVIDLDSSGNPYVSGRSDQNIHLPDTTSIF